MKNATITLFFILLCVLLGMMIYIYYPRVADKQYEIQFRQLVIDDLKARASVAKDRASMAETRASMSEAEVSSVIDKIREAKTLKELKRLYE